MRGNSACSPRQWYVLFAVLETCRIRVLVRYMCRSRLLCLSLLGDVRHRDGYRYGVARSLFHVPRKPFQFFVSHLKERRERRRACRGILWTRGMEQHERRMRWLTQRWMLVLSATSRQHLQPQGLFRTARSVAGRSARSFGRESPTISSLERCVCTDLTWWLFACPGQICLSLFRIRVAEPMRQTVAPIDADLVLSVGGRVCLSLTSERVQHAR